IILFSIGLIDKRQNNGIFKLESWLSLTAIVFVFISLIIYLLNLYVESSILDDYITMFLPVIGIIGFLAVLLNNREKYKSTTNLEKRIKETEEDKMLREHLLLNKYIELIEKDIEISQRRLKNYKDRKRLLDEIKAAQKAEEL